MPPKKKRKPNNFHPDTDSAKSSDSDTRNRAAEDPVTVVTELADESIGVHDKVGSLQPNDPHSGGVQLNGVAEGEGMEPSKPQTDKPREVSSSDRVKGFPSQQALARHASSLGIKRVMLADLQQQSDLDEGFVGGAVMAHCSLPYSQGHDLAVFVQDESTSQSTQTKHLRVTISAGLAECMPVLRDNVKIFLYRAEVRDETGDLSQDHGKCLFVEGPDAEVWVVHRDVSKPGFFSEKSCGRKWWTRTKEMRDKMKALW